MDSSTALDIINLYLLIFFENNYYKKSALNRDLGDNYTQRIIHLYYNEQWDLIPLYNKSGNNMISS